MSDHTALNGTVEKILELETFDSGFSKQVLVLNTGGKYPQLIPIEFVKDKTGLLNGLQEGQPVEVAINIRGNEYKGKYYANIQGWKIDKGNGYEQPEPGQQSSLPARTAAGGPSSQSEKWEDEESQIPF